MKLIEIIDRLCVHGGHTVTLVDAGGVETVRRFAQLHDDVFNVVERMKTLGVTSQCRVGIVAPSHYAFMVWDLACIALGCVSMAFPNERPQRDLSGLSAHHDLTLLAAPREWLPGEVERGRLVDIDPAAPVPLPTRRVVPITHVHAPHTHSLVFSSGTTGRTKGLVTSSAGTEHLLDLYHAAFGVATGERFLTFLPFANYQQRMIYYFCLYHGVDFVSVPFPQLFAGLKKHAPTFVIAPPILYESLQALTRASLGTQAADAEAVTAKLRELTGGRMRYMITGMAPIKRAALDFFWDHGLALYDAFGITEAGMVAWNKPGQVKVGTLGQPAEPGSVTLSAEGEVIVTREALLSLGYFESSDEDAGSTFVGPRSVATGDIAEFDEEGFLCMRGRKKDAIITRNGEKFHPEPIEALLHRDPRVQAAVVMADDSAGLAAVLSVKQPDDDATRQALQAHVAAVNETLPAQQQVKRLIFTAREFTLDNGLRTQNLKLNRRAIAASFLAS